MDTLYIFLIFAIGIIIAIGVGIQISQSIESFIIKVLFWLLYIVTIFTFINIILVGKYYLTMKDKTGPPGKPGVQGDRGDSGDVAKCDPGCRDSICTTQLMDLLTNELRNYNNGVAVKINNIYIKSKIKQICESEEFRQLAPYNGPQNLINYIKEIWKIWISLLITAGGMLYFETIGAEDQFEWLAENPFDEIKKYDVFYWGMGKQYRPQISTKCYNSTNGNTPDAGSVGELVLALKTDVYELITDTTNNGSYMEASFWRAKQFTYKGAVFYPAGDVIIGPNNTNAIIDSKKHIGSITYPYNSVGPNRETIIVAGDVKGPIDYELIWANNTIPTSSGKTPNYFWVWRPIAPVNYMALGDVITTSSNPPDTGNNAPIRCVPKTVINRTPANGNVMWSSNGSQVDVNLNILGFIPNTGAYTSADESNVYNLFRAVVGYGVSIPETDINANFYYMARDKYNSNIMDNSNSIPNMQDYANRVGKGYIPTEQKSAKYSVVAYLNLKNNPVLTHIKTNTKIDGQIIQNAIANCYILKIGEKCLKYKENELILGSCDDEDETQFFSIIFNGIVKNQCVLKHVNTGRIIKYKAGLFTLDDENTGIDRDYTLFTME